MLRHLKILNKFNDECSYKLELSYADKNIELGKFNTLEDKLVMTNYFLLVNKPYNQVYIKVTLDSKELLNDWETLNLSLGACNIPSDIRKLAMNHKDKN
jgi:hypothetical protein